MITFIWENGKKKGAVNISKLALYLRKNVNTLRSLQKRDSDEFHYLHMGAVCEANDIDIDDLIYLKSKLIK